MFFSPHTHAKSRLESLDAAATISWLQFRYAIWTLSHVDAASALNFRCAAATQTNGRCAGDWAFSLKGSSLTPRWPSAYVLIWIHANTCCQSHASRRGRAGAYSSPGMRVFYTLTNTPQLCFNFMVSTRIYIRIHLATLQCKCCHIVAVFTVLVGWRI